MQPAILYKIVDSAAWQEAERIGVFTGSPVDHADGYMHFSTASQVEETAARHFSGTTGLILAAIDAARLGGALRWEPSRGGDLFPHLYAPLDLAAVRWVRPLPVGGDGRHIFPALEA